eukprot:scaffold85531_cov31-Phaeocystis_antarctica.AAC.1
MGRALPLVRDLPLPRQPGRATARPAGQSAVWARNRLPRLLGARLAALTGLALPGERPAHWVPSQRLGCSS